MSSSVSCMSAARRRISGALGSSTGAAFCSSTGLPIFAMRRTAIALVYFTARRLAAAGAGQVVGLEVGAVDGASAAPAPDRRAQVEIGHGLAGAVERRERDVGERQAQVADLVAELDLDHAFAGGADFLHEARRPHGFAAV